jgi:hypothetical protein
LMLVLASIVNLFPRPALVGPGKQKFSFAFVSAVAVQLRRNDFTEGCG